MLYRRYMNYSCLYNNDSTTKLPSKNWRGVVTMSSAMETEFQSASREIKGKPKTTALPLPQHWTTYKNICVCSIIVLLVLLTTFYCKSCSIFNSLLSLSTAFWNLYLKQEGSVCNIFFLYFFLFMSCHTVMQLHGQVV